MKKSLFTVKPLAASIAALAVAAPLASFAQEGGIQEITITAQFREENLQETPLAVTAVSDEMMRARGQASVAEVAQQAPNVQIKQNSGPYGASAAAFIRGVGQGDANFAFEPGVGMYIDDIYYPTMTGSNFDLVDLERIEILRGPQGTLQGRNAIGGAVRLITKQPTGDNPGYMELTTGSYDQASGRAAGDIALSDNLFMRVSVAGENQDGFVDQLDFACDQPELAAEHGIPAYGNGSVDCKLGTLGGRSWFAGRTNMVWYATDRLQVNFAADKTVDNSEATGMVLIDGRDDAVNDSYGSWFNVEDGGYYTYENYTDPESMVTGAPFTTPPVNELTSEGLALTLDYELNADMSLKYIVSQREFDNQYATSYDGSPLNGETAWQDMSGESMQNELRLNGVAGDFDYTVGLFHFTQDNFNRYRVDIGYLGIPFDFIGHEEAESTSQAVFAHTVWHATDFLKVTAGIRYSDEEKDQILGRLDPRDGVSASDLPSFATMPESGYVGPVTFEDDRFDYRLSVDYQWTDSLLTYATYSTGYKNGGVSPRFFFASHIVPFGVEEMENYELGMKTDLFNNSMRLNAAIFYNEYTDQQTSAPGQICPDLEPTAPCLAIGNYVDSDYWGWELEMNWFPTDNTTVDLSLSGMGMEYSRISDATLENPYFITDPSAPPGIPELKASLGIQHMFMLPDGASLTPRLDINSEAARKSSLSNTLNVPSFTTGNLSVAWRDAAEEWEVIGRVNNVTDEYYFHNMFDQTLTAGFAAGQPAMPRTWQVSIRRNFY